MQSRHKGGHAELRGAYRRRQSHTRCVKASRPISCLDVPSAARLFSTTICRKPGSEPVVELGHIWILACAWHSGQLARSVDEQDASLQTRISHSHIVMQQSLGKPQWDLLMAILVRRM